MNQLLDDNFAPSNNRKPLKILSLLFALLPVIIAVLVLMKVYTEHLAITNPLLPFYTAFYIHADLLNFMTIQIVGILPAIVFRIYRLYILSIISVILFLIAGFYFKSSVSFYEWYYHLA